MTTLIALAALFQDKPIDIPKAEWPSEVECAVCLANGVAHGAEKPVAGVRYKDSTFYFCNKKEIGEFKKDPDAYLPPVLPRPMAKFELADTMGKMWTNDAFKDRVVLVDFWATWCEPCKKLKPIVEDLHTTFEQKGLQVLSVSIDEKRSVLEKHLAKNPFTNPVLHDSALTWQAWKVRVVPTLFLVKNGEVVAQWTGLVDKASLSKAVVAALDQ